MINREDHIVPSKADETQVECPLCTRGDFAGLSQEDFERWYERWVENPQEEVTVSFWTEGSFLPAIMSPNDRAQPAQHPDFLFLPTHSECPHTLDEIQDEMLKYELDYIDQFFQPRRF